MRIFHLYFQPRLEVVHTAQDHVTFPEAPNQADPEGRHHHPLTGVRISQALGTEPQSTRVDHFAQWHSVRPSGSGTVFGFSTGPHGWSGRT